MARIVSEQGAEIVEGNRSISEQPNESLIDELQEQCDEQQKVIYLVNCSRLYCRVFSCKPSVNSYPKLNQT